MPPGLEGPTAPRAAPFCRRICEAHPAKRWDGPHACGCSGAWRSMSGLQSDAKTLPGLPEDSIVDIKNEDWD